MKKIIRLTAKIVVLTLLSGILTVVAVILFPQPLFAHKMSYGQFTVYANDQIKVSVKPVLDSAMGLVKKSELYDPAYRYHIILAHHSLYNTIDDTFLGIGPTARTTLNNIVFKVRTDPGNNLAYPTFYQACKVNLTEVIAHEMIHCLQAHKYGLLQFNPFRHPDFWKLEGYPEYIARVRERSRNPDDLRQAIATYAGLTAKAVDGWVPSDLNDCQEPLYYYKGRLMVEYLMNVKHWSSDHILKDTSSENTIFHDMTEWSGGLE